MAPDSLRFFQNAPDAPKKDADASPKVDLSEFERRYRSLKDMAARGELKDTLGTILATRDAGQCLRTGQWYVESVQDGVWLSPIGTENLGVSRPKTFVSYFELEHSIDDLLTSLAVPSNGLDSLRAGTPARDSAKDDAGTTSSDAPTDANRDNTEAPQDPEAVARAERLAKLLMDYPDAHRFYSFGELVSPSKREVESIVRPENFLQIREHPRSEFVREVSKDARYTPESAKERIVEETRRLDRQIDRAGERWATTLQNLLVDVRQNLAGNAPTDFSLQTGEAVRNMTVTVDRMMTPGYEAWAWDVWDFTRDSFHLLRWSISTASGQVLSEVKDLTSRKLFELGPKEAPVERFIRESVAGNDEKPDAIRRGIIQWMKATPATMSGVIDATLDTTQSGIDLAVAPDKVLENVRNFVQGLSSEFLDTLLHDMTNEAEFSDFVYATSYVVTVFAVGLRLGPELWVLTIPKLIAQLVRSGMISASVSERLTKALLHLEPEIRAGAARIAQELPRAAEKTATSVRWMEKVVGKIDDGSTSTWTVVPPAEVLSRAQTLFRQAGDAALIANTFSQKVREHMRDGMSPQANADLAVDLFVSSFSEGKQNTRADLRRWRESEKNTRASYWLERTERRFDEVEKVFEREVFPILSELDIAITSDKPDSVDNFWQAFDKNHGSMNLITIKIVEQYKNR